MPSNRSQSTDVRRSSPPTQKKNRFQKYFQTPKGYVLVLLIALSLFAQINLTSTHGLRNEIAGIVTALVIDTIFAIAQKRKKLFADGGIITAMIIAMVLSTKASLIAIVVTTAIAVLSKHILKNKRKPIFNPAAFGLLIATFLFSSGQSWWGALSLLPMVTILGLVICGFLITSRTNKFPQVLTYLGVYSVAFLVMGLMHVGLAGDALRTPFINSAVFMAFFMLTDPPTSPGTYRDQIIYSVLASAISVALYIWVGGLTYLLVGLLCANAWSAWQSHLVAKKRSQQTPPRGQKQRPARPAHQ